MADDYAGDVSTTGAASVGELVRGNIEIPNDRDWFRITLNADITYQFDLKGNATDKGTLADPFLRLRDVSGTSLDFNDNNGVSLDSRITYKPTYTGTYYISVGSSDLSNGRGTYQLGATALGGTADGGTFVSIERIDKSSAGIDPTLETWVFVHGLNSKFDGIFNTAKTTFNTTLYEEINEKTDNAQILAIEWDADGKLPSLRPLETGELGKVEDRIPNVAEWAADRLRELGFRDGSDGLPSNLNFIGHSFGCYVSDEIAEEFGVVESIIALDPAPNIWDLNPLSGYNPNSSSEVNFDAHSAWSWAFHDGDVINAGSEKAPTTANEAFVIVGGGEGGEEIADWWREGHNAVVLVFANLLADPEGSSDNNGYFSLEKLLDEQPGPWVKDKYTFRGLPETPVTNPGYYEAVVYVDGSSKAPTSIQFVSDTTAPIEPQSILPVAVGGTATISTAFLLSYDDISGPSGVIYKITQAPLHGALLLDGVVTSTFTQAEIDAGLVQYRQDGAVATADGFMFTIFDEAGNWIGPEPFTIAIVDTTDPVVFANNSIILSTGNPSLIWKDALSTVALGSDPMDMVYTLLAAPAHGALVINDQPVSSFTQADIDNGFLNYVQPGGSAYGDSFSFVVTDGTGKQTAPQNFQILIQGGIVAAAAMNAPATFGFSDIASPTASLDLFAGWSDNSGAAENGDAMFAAYLELEPRRDEAGDSGGGW
jgi:hypothetical protein